MALSDTAKAVPSGEWVLAGLLAANLAWTTVCLGGVRAETMVLSWAFTGATLALQLAYGAWKGRSVHAGGWWLLPFLAYAAISVAVITPVPWLGKRDWLGWAQMIAIFWIALNGLRHPWPRLLILLTVLGLAVFSVLLAAYQRFIAPDWLMLGRVQVSQYLGRSSGSFGNPNNFAVLLVLAVPPLLALTWQRGASAVQRILFGYLATMLLCGLALTISRGAWLALALAVAAWPLFLRRQAWASRVLLSATAMGLVVMLGVMLYSTMPRVKERIDDLARDRGETSRPVLWQAAARLWGSAPVLGTGAGSFNTLFEKHRPESFHDEPQWAHNDYLNTLSDYGAIGFILFFGGLGVLGVKTAMRRRHGALVDVYTGWRGAGFGHGLAIGLMAVAVACLVDFHLKIPAVGMWLALAAAELVRRYWPPDDEAPAETWRQLGGVCASVVVVVGTLAIALPAFQGEASRQAGRQRIDLLAMMPNPTLNQQKEALTEARALLGEAIAFDESNAQSWADSAYVAALWSHLAPTSRNDLGREAERAARAALARSQVVPEFWVRLGVALDLQGRWNDGSEAFLKALTLAPTNALIWYHQAYHLSLNPRVNKLALVAVETCLRLDPNHAAARSLHQRLSSTSP